MRQLNIILLLSIAILCSGYRWRCYIFCDEQTGVQNDYTEERDICRNYAQDHLESEMAKTKDPNSPKARQARLVSLFSECMSKYGWDVPSGNPEPKVAENNNMPPIYVTTVSKAAPPPAKQIDIQPLIAPPKATQCKTPSKKKTKGKKKHSKTPVCDNTESGSDLEKAATKDSSAKKTAPAQAPQPAPAPAEAAKPVEPQKAAEPEKPKELPFAIGKKPEPVAPKPQAPPAPVEPPSQAPIDLLDSQLGK